jgi:hypothetical protein
VEIAATFQEDHLVRKQVVPEEYPTVTIETPLAGGCYFLVTKDRDIYIKAVQQRRIAFSWKEMLTLLDAEPSRAELTWALATKKQTPWARIDNIKTRAITTKS